MLRCREAAVTATELFRCQSAIAAADGQKEDIMFAIEYQAFAEHQYREAVLFPLVARRQRAVEDLQRARCHEQPHRRGTRGRLGDVLVCCGVRLARYGRRLQEQERGVPAWYG
jgi:hypothetical protein